MSKTFTAILFFLLSAAAAAFAQTHTLDLSRQDLQVRLRSFYISRVIDARIVDSSVGVVQKSIVNSKAAAVFPKPLAEEFYTFFSLHLPRQDGQLPLMLRVNKLWVSEHTTSSAESGTAEVRLDFIYEQDSLYYLLYSAVSLKTRYGMVVTHKHEENIAGALAACLQEFANRDFSSMLAQAERLTLAQVNRKYDNAATTHQYPILTAASYTPGVYLTLDEFRNNSPGIISGYEIKERSGLDKFMTGGGSYVPVMATTEGKDKPMKEAWGFSDGEHLFMNVNGSFVPLALVNGNFLFMGPPASNGVSTATVVGSVAGGIVGGVVAGGIAAAATKPSVYTLNLETGNVEIDGVPVGMSSEPPQLILYREQKNQAPQAVTVTVNDVSYTLETNQLLELALDTQTAGTTICIDGANDACHSFMPAPGVVYYIACTLDKKREDAKPALKQVDKALGEYAVKGIKFAQLKAEKRKNKRK